MATLLRRGSKASDCNSAGAAQGSDIIYVINRRQFPWMLQRETRIQSGPRDIVLRAGILEIHEANPVARCCDLTWRSVVLWLFSVYVNFKVISLNKKEGSAMVGDHGAARDRGK